MIERSEQINELATALAKAQAAVKVAIKDSDNPHFRSKYADLTAIWDACRGALTTNGLSVVQMPVESGEGRVALTTMLLHTSGQFLSATASTRLAKDDPQGVGSGLTYLRRYALAATLGIVADVDDDGNAASYAPQEQSQPRVRAGERVCDYDNTPLRQSKFNEQELYCPECKVKYPK